MLLWEISIIYLPLFAITKPGFHQPAIIWPCSCWPGIIQRLFYCFSTKFLKYFGSLHQDRWMSVYYNSTTTMPCPNEEENCVPGWPRRKSEPKMLCSFVFRGKRSRQLHIAILLGNSFRK